MSFFDFLISDQQRINNQIPGSMAKLSRVIRDTGPEAGPTAALRQLASKAAVIRAGAMRGSLVSAGDTFGSSIHKETKRLEPIWWADRACYMTLKDMGRIQGGPDVPELWDAEMEDFIRLYYAPDLV